MSAQLVVVGVDGSPASYAALRWVLAHAEHTGAQICAVRCWTPVVARGWEAAVTAEPVPPEAEQQARAGRELAQVVAAALARVPDGANGVAVGQRVVRGPAGSVHKRGGLLFRGPDVALLLLRAMIGVVFIAHGSQKLFGAFGGGGLDTAAKAMDGFGLRPGMFFAVLAGISEVGGGLLLLIGLLTPLAGLVITGLMVVAIAVSTGPKGFIVIGGLGYEYNLVLIAIALALVIAGPGRLSLDHQLGLGHAVADRVRRWRKNPGVVGQ